MAGRAAVGLDIGASGVRAAELSFGKGPATLERFGQVALPPGAVRDGEIVNADTVSHAIRQLWSQAKFTNKRVALGVANQRVIVRQVDLPWMPLQELRKSLAFQVQDYVPMPVEQAILDVHPLEEFTGDNGARMLRVLLVAAARDMVTTMIETVEHAGLSVSMVDLTPFALLRAVARHDQMGLSGMTEALIEVGASVTNIVIQQGGVPRFVRILLMGGTDMTDAVAERMGVPHEQAESVKQQMGIAPQPGTPVSDHPAARVLENSGATFVDEVRGSLDYYLAAHQAAPIGRIVLSGGGSQLAGLAQRLSTVTRLPVELGNPLASLRIGKTGLSPEQLSYVAPLAAVPVGLAMGVSA